MAEQIVVINWLSREGRVRPKGGEAFLRPSLLSLPSPSSLLSATTRMLQRPNNSMTQETQQTQQLNGLNNSMDSMDSIDSAASCALPAIPSWHVLWTRSQL